MLTAVCPHCSHSYRLADSLIGKRATCKHCRNVFVIEELSVLSAIANSAAELQLQQVPKPNPESFSVESGLWNVGDVILGIYEVKPIAEGISYASGGVGVVHRVYHREWDIDLAVKSPKPQFFQTEHGKKSYEQEAQTWVELGLHPNIVTCYLVRRIGGIPRLFSEFVSDGSLRDWIFDGRLYDGGHDAALLRILNFAIQFAWGLDHAHHQTLLHLDVKPANVMIADQTAKVADFGLSQSGMGGSKDATSGNYVTVGMTPGYCSPEQYLAVELLKQQQFDQMPKLTIQADMWSWAVSVFGMFFGGPPCNTQGGQNARAVLQKFLQRPPSEKRPAMPEAIAELLMQCFEYEPAKRPVSMTHVADELTKIYKSFAGMAFPRPKPINSTWTPDSINNRAVSLLDLNKPGEASKLFNQAIAMQPWHPAVTYNRTILSWRLAQLTDVAAIQQLETLVKMRPTEARALYSLGLAQRERGKLAVALEVFNDALAMEDRDDVRQTVAATKKRLTDEARCLKHCTIADVQERKVYAESKGEFVLFYDEPQTLALYSTINGQLRRTFKVPTAEPKESERFALSNDLLWELLTEQGGFLMRRVGVSAPTHSFQKINWGRRSAKQVVLADKALLGDILHNRVVISNLTTKHVLGSLLGHEGDVTALAFSHDGRIALTAGDDLTLRLWELSSFRCLRTYTTPKQTIDAVYLDPSGLFALSVTAGGALRLWSTAVLCRPKAFRAPLQLSLVTSAEETERQQSEMECLCNNIRQSVRQRDYASALDWMEQAKQQSGWESARYLLEIDGATDKIRRHTIRECFDSALCTHTLSGHQNAVTCLAISLDANLIASAGQDGEIRVWNIAEQKCVADLEGHQDEVRSLAMTTDAKFLISGSRDGSVRIWNIESGQCVRIFGERIGSLTKIALNPREQMVAIADAAGTILLWNVLTNSTIARLSNHSGGVNVLRFSRDGHYLMAGEEEGTVTIWQISNRTATHTFRDLQSPITAVAWTVDRNRCFVSDQSGRIVIRNLQTNEKEQIVQGHIGEISGLELLSDARFLFSSAKEGTVKVWRLTEPLASASIEGHPAAVTAMKLEISGRRLVTGCADGVVRAWELLWNYSFPGSQPVSAKAQSVLVSLLSLYSTDGVAKPKIDETIASRILLEMDYCGFGTIPSEKLKKTMNDLLADWGKP